jgi:hypothetical protein
MRRTEFRQARGLAACLLTAGLAGLGHAQAQQLTSQDAGAGNDLAVDPATCTVQRPAVNFNRWNENWNALASPCVPKKPFDGLKYIPLTDDGWAWLSLGGGLRERMETNNAALFGRAAGGADTYVIQRLQLHADLRLGAQWQFFTQVQDDRAFGKNAIGGADVDQWDLEQAFAAYVTPMEDGQFKARVGRQEMAFDLQRFIAARDGPNVRQSFDGLWADREIGPWRLIAYATQPVQYRSDHAFDDVSDKHLRFNGVRIERQNVGPGDLSGYYSRFDRDGARFLDAVGDERRDVYDLRYSGKTGRFDWDVEGMDQRGSVGGKKIAAWALGSIAGYTWSGSPWRPRAGLQFDMATGDRHPGDGRLGTFNPLFPNGYYFALAGYTGYSNLIHLKPSLTLKPLTNLTLMAATGLQWRETTADAVYGQGSAAVANTANRGSLWTGVYAQFRADWTLNANVAAAVEAVHFQVGDSLRQAGARNGDYLGLELKLGW